METFKILDTGQIVNYQNYGLKDQNLIVSSFANTEMDPNTDLVEITIYGENNDFLEYFVDVRTYKIVQGSVNPVTGFTNKIEVDPITDARNLGINRGRINVQYNFLKPLFNSSNLNTYWIKQISPSRTELKLTSQFLSNDQIRSGFSNFQTYVSGKPYYVDFYINFGQNRLLIANNAAIVEEDGETFLLIKLYDPLPIEFSLKDTFWICDKISDSAIYSIDVQVSEDAVTVENALRGPNWKVKVNDVQGQTTPYYNYSSLFSSDLSSSMQQLASYYDDKGIELNVDYTNFSNFVHFSSAKERVNNFVYKLGLIEQYEQEIQDAQSVSNANSFAAAAVSQSSVVAQQKIDRIIEKFDVYEYYLYYASESFAWPKSTSTKPYALYSVTSSEALLWLGDEYTQPSTSSVSLLYSASLYDDTNKDKLSNSIPQYLLDDLNNQSYVTFIDMVGQHFDNIWLYYKDISNRYSSFNSPNFGISKDIIADALRSFGFNLYTNTSVSDNLYYTIFGMNPDGSLLPPTGSEIIDNYVTSSIDTLSPKDLNAEVYKRLYHNMTYLLKTKGTQRGVKALICSYGIPEEILTVNEFGGNYIYTGSGLLEINNNKIRYFSTSSELSNPVLSPFVTIQQYNTDYRINSETVEAGFSPADQINRNIVSSSGFFGMDQLVGNPTHQYLPYYPDLKAFSDNYFASYNYPHSIWEYVRIIKYYNNSLFKTIKDWVPAKSNPSTGIIVKSHILERNKYARTEPSMSFDNNISESIDMLGVTGSAPGAVVGSTQYTENIITPLGYASFDYTEDKAKITGRLSGSFIQATNGEAFDQSDFSTTASGSVEVDFPANYQNIVTNSRSKRFLELDYAYNQSTPVNLGLITQSISKSIDDNFDTYNDPYAPYADIQDYNYATRAFTDARYYGSRVSSRFYNVYTSASTGYAGDSSYGKTAAIDRNSVKIGWVKNIPSQSLNFYNKTNIYLKYLVDANSQLIELNTANNNLFEVQNTFKSGTPVVVSISDVNNPSFQKDLDGEKMIFRGGYSYDPILYREANETLAFEHSRPISQSVIQYGVGLSTKDDYTYWARAAGGTDTVDYILISPSAEPSYPNAAKPDRPNYAFATNFDISNASPTLAAAGTVTMATLISKADHDSRYTGAGATFSWGYIGSGLRNSVAEYAYRMDLVNLEKVDSFRDVVDLDTVHLQAGQNNPLGKQNYYYKTPRGGRYKFTGQFYLNIYNSDKVQGGSNLIKFFTAVEKSTDLNNWEYVGCTKLQLTSKDNSLYCPINSNTNEILLDNQGQANFLMKLDLEDTASQSGTYYRFVHYLLTYTDIFGRTGPFTGTREFRFTLGTRESINSNLSPDTQNQKTFVQIQDLDNSFTQYNYTSSYAQLPALFSTGSATLYPLKNTIVFSASSSYLFDTASYFVPNLLENYYTQVVDPISIQKYDLIRLSRFKDVDDNYYEVTDVQISGSARQRVVTLNAPISSSYTTAAASFAILRPKPDETSVIVNYRKRLGEVSPTILIPYDLKPSIKDSVGDIFKTINTELQ